MAQIPSLRPTAQGVTPAPFTPNAGGDTIIEADLTRGAYLRVTTTSTLTNVTVVDPRPTPLNNVIPQANTPVVAVPAGAVRTIFVGPAAVNPATGQATVSTSAQTGVSFELYPL